MAGLYRKLPRSGSGLLTVDDKKRQCTDSCSPVVATCGPSNLEEKIK